MQIHARILEAEVHLCSSCAGVLLDRSIQVASSSPGATTLVRVVSQSTRKPRASVMKFAGVILWRGAWQWSARVLSSHPMSNLRAAERHNNLPSFIVSRDVSVRVGY